eukprot:TRINITY_DN21171_c0_g1_i1.p1 TRINITY_DN21171_c0_g1~~TRINITY_DN21171_c0_g1_i1.p1  ORF type:complete len:132 (+),score=46.88 TRINITY_DN21171_c0_g1_i1:63-458(+)
MDAPDYDGSGSEDGNGLPSMTFVQVELFLYGAFLLAFGIGDYVLGGRYELHIMIDAAGGFCFPVTVLYFYYQRVALSMALFGCVAVLMYFCHHLHRTRQRRLRPVTLSMILLTLYIASQTAGDLRKHWAPP